MEVLLHRVWRQADPHGIIKNVIGMAFPGKPLIGVDEMKMIGHVRQ